jgi:hypothetical protein
MGAKIGAREFMAIRNAIKEVNLCPENRSQAMERDRTIPPDAARPCRKRKSTKNSMHVSIAHRKEQIIKIKRETIKGLMRPYVSESGPIINCPKANPKKDTVKDNWIREGLVS